MKSVYLIDTPIRQIVRVDSELTLEGIYGLLQIHENSRMVEQVYIDHSPDVLLVDEEGLFRPKTQAMGSFYFGRPFVGRGLIVGVKGENWTSTTLRLEAYQKKIRFL